MARIQLDNVSKRYGGTTVVDGATFTIGDGEFFILVGPSGCGKSTLLNMIVGLEEISEGELLVDGERINEVDPKDRNMAMVFQSYAIYPHMTVRENLAFPLKLARLGKAEIAERIATAAAMLELTPYLDRKPAALSGGQRQRVAMGRAMVREPRVFLLDEPLSNLDARLRVQMRAEIARLQRRLGTTTVYVTHDQTEAMTLGDRIAVLRGGRVQQVGTPRALYEHPANLFVAGFIGSPGMNFLPAKLTGPDSPSGPVRGGGLELPVGTLAMPEDVRRRLAGAGALVAGFRPDHLSLNHAPANGADAEGLVFEARVDVVEWLGSDTFVHLDVPLEGFGGVELPADLGVDGGPTHRPGDGRRQSLTARLDPGVRLAEGDRVRLRLQARSVHVFDAASGDNLTHADRPADDAQNERLGGSPRET